MKPASISEIKQELNTLPPAELLEICLRLVRYKKENKELLSYLLFESHDLPSFIKNVRAEMDVQFDALSGLNGYLLKKSLRKILKTTNTAIKHTGSKEADVELRMYFCIKIKQSGISLRVNKTLQNMYLRQIKMIQKSIALLHEDLQHDYEKQLELLLS